MNGIFTINWTDVKSAAVYAFVAAFLAATAYVMGVGDIFALSGKTLANVAVLAALAAFASLVKNTLTTSTGAFLGMVQVKDIK